jgi:hypothetical protein
LLSKFYEAINSQTSTAVVAGFTNTIAPASLFTPTLSVGSGSLTITHVNKGGVPNIITNFTSTTASVSVTTNGLDKFYNPSNWYSDSIKFDGSTDPYTSLIRKG